MNKLLYIYFIVVCRKLCKHCMLIIFLYFLLHENVMFPTQSQFTKSRKKWAQRWPIKNGCQILGGFISAKGVWGIPPCKFPSNSVIFHINYYYYVILAPQTKTQTKTTQFFFFFFFSMHNQFTLLYNYYFILILHSSPASIDPKLIIYHHCLLFRHWSFYCPLGLFQQ